MPPTLAWYGQIEKTNAQYIVHWYSLLVLSRSLQFGYLPIVSSDRFEVVPAACGSLQQAGFERLQSRLVLDFSAK